MSGAFRGDPAIKAVLLGRIDRHRAAGTLIFGPTAWDGERGSPLGISVEGTDPADYAAVFGYPLGLAALLDPLAADPVDGFDAAGFVREWVAVVRPGADLSRVPAALMLGMLHDLNGGEADAALVTAAVALHRDCRDGGQPPRPVWATLRRDILASMPAAAGAAGDLLEAAAWPAAHARSSLTSAFAAWRRLRAGGADPGWTPRDEARKEAMLHAIWEAETPAREAGEQVHYHARLVERDADLAGRFLLHLDRTNAAALGAAERLARTCVDLLGAA